MEKSYLFFTYLGKLKPQKDDQKKDEFNLQTSVDKSNGTIITENEWIQEYELIYQSYTIG